MIDTPHQGHQPIAMHRVVEYSGVEKAGDFYWYLPAGSNDRYLAFAVPSKTETNPDHYLFQNLPVQQGQNISGWCWGWNGNEDKPTLTPSVHAIGHWHGWVCDGMLIEA